MTDAVATTAEITDPLQTHTEADPIDNMSPADLLDMATKMAGEEAGAGTSEPVEKAPAATEETPAEAPADAVEAPAAPEAPAVDPLAKEREERLAKVMADAGAWREKKALREAQAAREAEAARYKAEVEAAKAEAAALKARLDSYRDKDPSKILEAFERDGVPADAVAQFAVKSGTPEYQREQELRALREEVAAIKADREAAAKAQAEAAERAAKAQQEQAYAQARQHFVQQASDAAAFPTLAKIAGLRPMALVQHAEEILAEATQRTGQTYTNQEILTYLENLYASNFGQPTKQSGTAASVTTPGTATGPSAPGTNAAGKPRTLTNGMAEKTGTTAKPADEMSAEEFAQWAKAQLASR
jgi:hypothetical protein